MSPHHSERHASMTVPLPSWNGIESALDASSRSIAVSTRLCYLNTSDIFMHAFYSVCKLCELSIHHMKLIVLH